MRGKYQKEYFRLTVTYADGESSGRVYKHREDAEKHAARQKKSPTVKKTRIESFIKDRHEWRKRRTNRQDKIKTAK